VHVSFLVPLFNCLPLTQAMVASLQATIPAGLSHEIILIDDGSTDGTREWLRTLSTPPFQVILNEQNLGYARANNRAAQIARGQFLALLNNDLVLTPNWLEPMVALHRSLPKPGTIGNIQLNATTGAIDHAGIYVTVKGKPEHDVTLPRGESKFAPAVTGACMLIDRSLWNKLNGFDEAFINGGEDIDLCFRASKLGHAHAVALRSIIRHHVSASPGRKRHDEQNSYRLTQRWRRELIHLGARAWAKHHVRHTPYLEPLAFPLLLAYAAGWLKKPPRAALRGVEKNIEHSLGIWTRMFGA
jgi:GT2 family glycosyltransferase